MAEPKLPVTTIDHEKGEGLDNFIEVKGLSVSFDVKGGLLLRTIGSVNAVNNISFSIKKGEILGVVGESGCGKSTLARLILRLIEPTRGSVVFNGENILEMSKKELKKQRGHMQMVFQDPFSVMDPRYTIFRSLSEPFEIWKIKHSKEERHQKVNELLEMVDLSPQHGHSYPHQLSGGQKQRADIARALALEPEFLILDEPTAALDVSVQAQVINLLEELRERLNLTYLFISHDLSLVSYFCDRVIVMYLGNIMEIISANMIGKRPYHPYTKALTDNIFSTTPNKGIPIKVLESEVPSPFNLPPGCVFASRCNQVKPICLEQAPNLQDTADGGQVACHFQLA
jgi:oligopeptide/dipeptide ABC transporter ATP-binding protein